MTNRIMQLLVLLCISKAIICQEVARLTEMDAPVALQPFKWIKGTPVNEFKKGRIYVVEFGATWCKPCAALIPVLAEITSKYRDVSVISNYVMEYINPADTTSLPDYVKVVEKYINKHGDQINYTVAVDDRQKTLEKTWLKVAGTAGIPAVFIIDRNGKIAWTGHNPEELKTVLEFLTGSAYNIKELLADKERKEKTATKYNESKLLLIDNNGGFDTSFLFRSVLTIYRGDINANGPRFISSLFESPIPLKGVIQCTGISLRQLYNLAYSDTLWNSPAYRLDNTNLYPDTTNPMFKRSYGRYWYFPVLEVHDSTLFTSDFKSPANRFNYSLKVPEDKATAAFMQKSLRLDLKKYFGYDVVVEKRLMPCWKIVVTDKAKAALTTRTPGSPFRIIEQDNGDYAFKNGEVRDIIGELEIRYGHTVSDAMTPRPNKQPPFIDATGIKDQIDFVKFKEQNDKIMESDPSVDTFEIYREMLKLNGIELVKGTQQMNVVVIRDAH